MCNFPPPPLPGPVRIIRVPGNPALSPDARRRVPLRRDCPSAPSAGGSRKKRPEGRSSRDEVATKRLSKPVPYPLDAEKTRRLKRIGFINPKRCLNAFHHPAGPGSRKKQLKKKQLLNLMPVSQTTPLGRDSKKRTPTIEHREPNTANPFSGHWPQTTNNRQQTTCNGRFPLAASAAKIEAVNQPIFDNYTGFMAERVELSQNPRPGFFP